MLPKELAAKAAMDHVKSGMVVGLGTGSTAKFFIDQLASALRERKLTNIRGVPTSGASEQLARLQNIPLVGFDQVTHCDVTVDGADEITPDLNLIKGLGGALLREKVVAQNSSKLIIIADESKRVEVLGTKAPLPVEIVKFSTDATVRYLESLHCIPTLRKDFEGKPFVTDNGNLIYDCRFERIENPLELDRALRSRAGVVETGLFINLASIAIIATSTSVTTLTHTRHA